MEISRVIASAFALGDLMELKQLKYFLCVAELGSFSKAAIKLAVAQPNLSLQIRSLELFYWRLRFDRQLSRN